MNRGLKIGDQLIIWKRAAQFLIILAAGLGLGFGIGVIVTINQLASIAARILHDPNLQTYIVRYLSVK